MNEPIPGSKLAKKATTYLPDIHRMLPQSPEAEQGVLASMLIAGKELWENIRDRGVTEDHFHIPAHRDVFTALADCMTADGTADFITLTDRLRGKNKLESVGGASFITSLFTFLPTAANVSYYLNLLEQKYVARSIIHTCTKYAALAYEADDQQSDTKQLAKETGIAPLLDDAQREICAISIGGKDDSASIRHISEGARQAITTIEFTYRNRGKVAGIPYGFHQLDRMTGGMKGGQSIGVGGRTSMGKSAFLWKLAENIAATTGPVLGWSGEMGLEEIAGRYICWDAKINMQRLRDGFLSDKQLEALGTSAARIATLRQWIDCTPGISIQELRAKARRFKLRNPNMGGIVVDYIQKMKSRTRRAEMGGENAEISEIIGGIKDLAIELNVPIIWGVQVNRDGDNESKPPKLSNLRGSGSLEQDADVVILLHRKHYYTKDDADKGKATADLAKQRNGPTGPIELAFTDYACFENPEGQALYSNNEDHRQ